MQSTGQMSIASWMFSSSLSHWPKTLALPWGSTFLKVAGAQVTQYWHPMQVISST